jgi:hypothetical protein
MEINGQCACSSSWGALLGHLLHIGAEIKVIAPDLYFSSFEFEHAGAGKINGLIPHFRPINSLSRHKISHRNNL